MACLGDVVCTTQEIYKNNFYKSTTHGVHKSMNNFYYNPTHDNDTDRFVH